MVDYVDLRFAPDEDTVWSKTPGALTAINAFAPLQRGTYGSMGNSNYLAISTGVDILKAQMFRRVAGTVRLLLFRVANIDEYDSAGTRTNRGTSYNASTADWSAAAWGDQIIACNYLDATQSSTGAGFSALGGSSPKARYVASNINFVMFADVDDGGSNIFSDMVWWSGIRNPATYAPSQATQAGYIRLLDVPGPIRQLVAFRETFIAFKDNGFMVGQYAGPPKLFSWRPGSHRVGCIAPNSVAELDGKLYWVHSSGFWCFDGQSLTNIGLPVFQSFLAEGGYISAPGTGGSEPSITFGSPRFAQVGTDEVEGVVWWQIPGVHVDGTKYAMMYGYNVRSGKWGRYFTKTGYDTADSNPALVKATTADIQTFLGGAAGRPARILGVWNDSISGTKIKAIAYPAVSVDVASLYGIPGFTTGVWGDAKQSAQSNEIFLRHMYGSTALVAADVTATWTAHKNEDRNTTLGTATATFNPEFNSLQTTMDARFKTLQVAYGTDKTVILGGVGVHEKATGKR